MSYDFSVPKFRTNFFHSVPTPDHHLHFYWIPPVCNTQWIRIPLKAKWTYRLILWTAWLKQDQRGPTTHKGNNWISSDQNKLESLSSRRAGVSSANVNVSNEMRDEKIIINGFVRDSLHDRLMMIRLLWRILRLAGHVYYCRLALDSVDANVTVGCHVRGGRCLYWVILLHQ